MAEDSQAKSNTYAMAKEALRRVNLLPKERDLADRYIRLVANVFTADAAPTKAIQEKFGVQPSVPLLANIGILKLIFGFENKELAYAMLDKHSGLASEKWRVLCYERGPR